ncbi:hypothetical protein LP2241_30127 [Pseudolactococcus piscium]|nr:hypothetical protein LP2241_30127 [Lactococcus piscium]
MHQCKEMNKVIFVNHQDFDNEAKMVEYDKKFDECGFPVRDGGGSKVTINYCPWCGKKLPESKLDDYMAILETLDIYGIGDEKIPDELKRDDWWEKRLCNKEGK